jgi:GNAT superfamily N-acetyltransferase
MGGVVRVRGNIQIVAMPVDHPVAAELVAKVEAELCARYQAPSIGTLDPAAFLPQARGLFVVAESGGLPSGCGGYRQLDQDTAELKRLFVDAPGRRRGMARAILHHLHDAARRSGYRRLWLETGTEQPEAIALYQSAGYQPIGPFGEHGHDHRSRFFGLDLLSTGGDPRSRPVR